jgi:starvation-inducible DNA-binding protein
MKNFLTRIPSGETLSSLLNDVLSDDYVLRTKSRIFKWNIPESGCEELRNFLEMQCRQLDSEMDLIAYRIKSLGHAPESRLRGLARKSNIREYHAASFFPDDVIHELKRDHKALIDRIRHSIDSAQDHHDHTEYCDFLCGLLENHERMAWTLDALRYYN